MNRNYNKLPKTVHDWLWLYKSWIVGSGVSWYINDLEKMPKDLDIVIPTVYWNDACKLLDKSIIIKTNTFGGFKTTLDGISVDFWPENIEDLLETIFSTTNQKETLVLRLFPYTLITATR